MTLNRPLKIYTDVDAAIVSLTLIRDMVQLQHGASPTTYMVMHEILTALIIEMADIIICVEVSMAKMQKAIQENEQSLT